MSRPQTILIQGLINGAEGSSEAYKPVNVNTDGSISYIAGGHFVYCATSGTINDGASDTSIALGSVTTAYSGSIVNDGVGDFWVKFNTNTNNRFVIKNGDELTVSDFQFTKMFIGNTSGSNADYRMIFIGD